MGIGPAVYECVWLMIAEACVCCLGKEYVRACVR